MNFNDTENGVAIGKWLGENNELREIEILSGIRKISKTTVAPIYEEGELVAFHFPRENIYLYRWGPDPTDPVWIDGDLDGELFGEEGIITKVFRKGKIP